MQAKLKGDEAFKQQDFETAVKHYTTAIEQNAINGTLAKHVLLSNRSACYCSLKKVSFDHTSLWPAGDLCRNVGLPSLKCDFMYRNAPH